MGKIRNGIFGASQLKNFFVYSYSWINRMYGLKVLFGTTVGKPFPRQFLVKWALLTPGPGKLGEAQVCVGRRSAAYRLATGDWRREAVEQ